MIEMEMLCILFDYGVPKEDLHNSYYNVMHWVGNPHFEVIITLLNSQTHIKNEVYVVRVEGGFL